MRTLNNYKYEIISTDGTSLFGFRTPEEAQRVLKDLKEDRIWTIRGYKEDENYELN